MKTVQDRQCGTHRIKDIEDGRGVPLKFRNVPDRLSGAFLNDISGLDRYMEHPLKGAVYHTKNNAGDTFNVSIFQNDLKEDVASAYANWFMGYLYVEYADANTKTRIEAAKKVPA